jgi:hypothetical protein
VNYSVNCDFGCLSKENKSQDYKNWKWCTRVIGHINLQNCTIILLLLLCSQTFVICSCAGQIFVTSVLWCFATVCIMLFFACLLHDISVVD